MAYTNDEINNTVEMILRHYYKYRAQAKLDKEELTELFAKCTASYNTQPHGTDMTDQTSSLVERRNEPTLAMKQGRAIEIIYESLQEELQEFCKLHFFEQKTRIKVMSAMIIEKDKFYDLKRDVINQYRDLLPWRHFGERKADMQTKHRQNTDILPNKTA